MGEHVVGAGPFGRGVAGRQGGVARWERRLADTAVADGEVQVRIWGARGSVACPGPETVRYGGNTACVEVRCGDRVLVLDGGTGIRGLGMALAEHEPAEIDVYLTHFHLDHVAGLPFFKAAYRPENRIRFHAARLNTEIGLRDILCRMMSPPLFPIPIDEFRAEVSFNEFDAGETLRPADGVRLETRLLNHPGGACGYRMVVGDRVIAYVTDTEHQPGRPDAAALTLMEGADIAIYDATYTDAEFETHPGWGHSTWSEGVRLADTAGVGTLVLFHHDPSHDDAAMDKIALDAAAARPGTLVAREGLVLLP